MSRSADRAARRAAASGSGPTTEQPVSRYPAARAGFALFGEVLVVGVMVTVASIPIVTMPAALAAGVRHLRRFLSAEGSGVSLYWRDLRAALPGGSLVGLVSAVLVLVLVLDIDLGSSGYLPGGTLIVAVGWVGLAALVTMLFAAAGSWDPGTGWRRAVRAAPDRLRGDPVGALYLLAAGVIAGVVTWQLAPLIVPALGCIAFAIVAVPERPRRADRGDAPR